MTTTEAVPDWEAGCSCGWRGMSEDAETHACAWDEAEEATDAARYQEAPSGPPEEVLKAVTAAREYLDRAERHAVRELRLRRFSWAEIGRLLGVSRQAVWQRFGAKE